MLKKRHTFEWDKEHAKSVGRLKEALSATSALWKAVYGKEVPIYVIVDSEPDRDWMGDQSGG